SLFALLCTGAVEYRARTPRTSGPRTGTRAADPTPSGGIPVAPPLPAAPPAAAAPPAPVPPRQAPKVDEAAVEAARRAAAEARRREIQDLYDSLRAKDHFEILGIPRQSSADDVKEAYFRMARPYHPDAALDPSLADLREKRNAVFIRLGEAYETLRNPASRARYENAFPPRRPRP